MDCHFVPWCQLSLEAQAAWVQAIGSIVAIAVAIAVPAVQRRSERRDVRESERLKARALAAVLRAPLEQWLSSFGHFEDGARGPDGRIAPRDLVAVAAADNGLFAPPRELIDNLASLHLFRSAGGLLFDAIRKSHEAKASASMLHEQCPDDELETAGKKLMSEIGLKYKSVQNDIGEALSEIVEIL